MRTLDQALDEFTRAKGDRLDGRRALIGYSLGAVAAMRIVRKQPQRWHRLMIVNASVTPGPRELSATALDRVAFVSGSRDATAGKLRAAATRLDAAGLRSKFFSLDDTGHYFQAETTARLAEPLRWLTKGWEQDRGESPRPRGGCRRTSFGKTGQSEVSH